MRCKNNIFYIVCWTEKLENTHLYSLKYDCLTSILYYQWKNCLPFFLCPSHSTTSALNPVRAYFLNKFNPTFILFFPQSSLTCPFYQFISSAVKKSMSLPVLKRLILKLQIYYWIWSLNPTSLIFPFSRFTSLLSLLWDESSKMPFSLFHFPDLKLHWYHITHWIKFKILSLH